MEYYKLLQLHREPFSNSPDPEYFFNSTQHMGCLQKLELALRLKRGLNAIIGDVGTGKTTLCRQLIRNFSSDPDIETHLILDPSFDSASEFLKNVLQMICSLVAVGNLSQNDMKEMIKRTLFRKGVDEGKTVVLIIDEGQKISGPCLEILRELLNYETNTFKLLQIVIFAQLEFYDVLKTHANFADRINLQHRLEPLSFTDTRQLIQHRLKLSSTTSKPASLFTLPALWAIYRASRGYPRKIIHLCHQSVLALIIQNQKKAGWALIQSCKKRLGATTPPKRNIAIVTSSALLVVLISVLFTPIVKSRLGGGSPPPSSIKIVSAQGSTMANPVVVEDTDPILPHKNEAPIEIETDNDAYDAVTHSEGHPSGPADQSNDNATPTPTIAKVVPDTTPLAESQSSPPEQLGSLIVQPGDTMSGLVLQVYGTRYNRFLRSVIEANPQIADPNDINISNTIAFPILTLDASASERDVYLVVLDEHRNLAAAIQRMRKLSSELNLKPKLVTSWSPSQGLRFQLIHRRYFTSSDAARIHIDQLPQSIASNAVIFTGWSADTVFYTDPFKKNGLISFFKDGD